ncbi:hypothetical protein LSH36_91g01076 [Paralvinella palmiformis]|uniref:Glycoprotein-N-acetylgalactosamine 3-beta-galactosyltransferase 1 n=1 Tax=Paralvinella palmiformis TaxID=53620 RepID=A0AAD9K1P7_9ANNE|nr:hypothetical protein LSH36_91g01076 [Paralvinella palmiformis]
MESSSTNDQMERKLRKDKRILKESGRVRLLCWVLIYPAAHQDKAIAIKETWGRRCDVLLFMSDANDNTLPAIDLEVNNESRKEHLTAKTRRAFDYVYSHHYDDADWFLKADDDTYVIVENLRHMLDGHAATEPVYFGEHFTIQVRQGFFSGGAGYVLSKEALRRYGMREDGACTADYKEAEDVFMGECLQELGISTGDSRDDYGRQRFHCLAPSEYALGDHQEWYVGMSKYPPEMGITNLSRYPISFHHINANLMYELEYLMYHIKICNN